MPERGTVPRLQALFEQALQMPAPAADADMIAGGLLDSLGLVTLLFEIEQEFGVQIALETLDLEDVRTLDRLAALVGDAPPEGPAPPGVNGHGPPAPG
jgi:acyl carrier protein